MLKGIIAVCQGNAVFGRAARRCGGGLPEDINAWRKLPDCAHEKEPFWYTYRQQRRIKNFGKE